MDIYVFSDFQGDKIIPKGNPDLVILLGNISHFEAEEINRTYSCPKIGVYGNHNEPNEWSNTGIQLIHGDTFEYKGITFGGFGGSPRYNDSKFNQYDEEDCYQALLTMEKVDVFITHSNPVYENNYSHSDSQRGFLSFNQLLMSEKKPKYFLHGHMHNPFTRTINDTTIYSVSPFKEFHI